MDYVKTTSQVTGVSTTQPMVASECGIVKNYIKKSSHSSQVTAAPLFLNLPDT